MIAETFVEDKRETFILSSNAETALTCLPRYHSSWQLPRLLIRGYKVLLVDTEN